MVDTNNYRALGDLLSRAKTANGKTFRELEEGFGVKGRLSSWHNGDQLPGVDRLPEIARVYGIDLAELATAYFVARAARDEETRVRRRATKIRQERRVASLDPEVYGGICSAATLSRTNQGVWRPGTPASRFTR